jgi:raffinose synthase
VDVQSVIGYLGSGLGGGPATAAAYHASLEASTRRHFPGNHLINCMCHSTEDLYCMEDTNLARYDPGPWSKHALAACIASCIAAKQRRGNLWLPAPPCCLTGATNAC